MIDTLNEKIQNFIDKCLSNSSFFLVDLYVSNNQRKVELSLDGDNGISIDKCAEISKELGAFLEEKELINHAYQLYVSSPGIDSPIKKFRQYHSRVGRSFSLLMTDGQKLKAKLLEVIGDELVFEIEEKGKGKKKRVLEEKRLRAADIEKAVVKLSFK